MSESRILVIDADAPRAERLAGLLEFMDLTPRWVASAGDVDVRRQRPHDWLAVVVGSLDDQKAADTFFTWLGKAPLPPPVLLLEGDTAGFAAAHGLHEAGVWALESPIRHAQLEACLRRASLKRLDTEHQAQQVTTRGPTGNSPAVTRLRRMIEQVASFDTTVLVLGESGTGKEVVARAIHDQSPRRDGPFVAINCGAIPPDLLERVEDVLLNRRPDSTERLVTFADELKALQGGASKTETGRPLARRRAARTRPSPSPSRCPG